MTLKRLFLFVSVLLACCVPVAGQQLNADQLTFRGFGPLPVTSVNTTIVGNTGNATYYYWVIAHYPIGAAPPSNFAVVNQAPGVLSTTNYIRIGYQLLNGATSYDVLKTLVNQLPSSCTCALATGATLPFVLDQGATLSSYTQTTTPASSLTMQLNNQNSTAPFMGVQLLNNSTVYQMPLFSGTAVLGDCVKIGATNLYVPTLLDSGSGCGGGGGTPGGSSGQVQYNNGGSFGGFTASGDATINTTTGALTFATVNGAPGTCGDATHVCAVTTNGKGLTTSQTAVAITGTGGISNPTVTTGTGSVTISNTVVKDSAVDNTYSRTSVAGDCGVGVAFATTGPSSSFLMQSVPGEVYTIFADNNITAGNVLVGSTSLPGHVHDGGFTSLAGIPSTTCAVGVAQTSVTTGSVVPVLWFGAGTFGSGSVPTAFSALTGGTNTSAAMTVGAGASLAVPTQTAGDTSTNAANSAFVATAINNAIAGANPAVAVLAASTATVTGTYANGASGVGATFTVTATGTFTLDGIAINTIGQRVLLKNQSSAFQNGIYTATVVGITAVSAVFTRATDYNQPSDINSTGAIPVQSGTANTTTSWLLTSTVNTIGTDSLTYAQFSVAPNATPTGDPFRGNVLETRPLNVAFIKPASGVQNFPVSPSTLQIANLTGPGTLRQIQIAVAPNGTSSTNSPVAFDSTIAIVADGTTVLSCSLGMFYMTYGYDAVANARIFSTAFLGNTSYSASSNNVTELGSFRDILIHFNSTLTVTLTNGSTSVNGQIYSQVRWYKGSIPNGAYPATVNKFHSTYVAFTTLTADSTATLCNLSSLGSGRIDSIFLFMFGTSSSSPWLEGHPAVTIDGSVADTAGGTEDFFGSNANFNLGVNNRQQDENGSVIVNAAAAVPSTYYTGMYKFYRQFPLLFTNALTVTIENGHTGEGSGTPPTITYAALITYYTQN